MTTTWVICGTGRGVGKTHTAMRLCEALPQSVYAKRGCAAPKAGKAKNYFRSEAELASFVDGCNGKHEHIVVECNSWARQGRGDINVFLDGIPHRADVRSDVARLRAEAHLRVGPGASVRNWKRVLRGVLPEAKVRETVCDILVAQKRFLSGSSPGPAVRTKVWFVFGEEHAFGAGMARLLENVGRTGTLRAAAESTHISYRHAWDLIKSCEAHLGEPLLITSPGGSGGGQSHLTDEGRRLLGAFKDVSAEVAAFADKCAAARLENGRKDRA